MEKKKILFLSIILLIGCFCFLNNKKEEQILLADLTTNINLEGKLNNKVTEFKVSARGDNELVSYNLVYNGNDKTNYKLYKTSSKVSLNKLKDLEPVKVGIIDNNTKIIEKEYLNATIDTDIVYYYLVLDKKINGSITLEQNDKYSNIIAAYITHDDGTREKVTTIPSGYRITSSECSGGATASGITPNIQINNINQTGVSCTLYLEELKPTTASTLIATADKTSITTSAGFGELETGPGGLYEFEGITSGSKTQFYRGAVTNNYVKLGTSGNYTYWRIVRFDEDGNIRLIYDGTSAHSNGEQSDDRQLTVDFNGTSMYTPQYHSIDAEANVKWSNSPIKTYLEGTWLTVFENKLSIKEQGQLTTGKFCSDTSVSSTESGVIWYGSSVRLDVKKEPSFECGSEDVTTSKVGMLSADEYSFAGGTYSKTNTSFYLYTGKSWWTMSPNSWDADMARVNLVHQNGSLVNNGVTANGHGVLPVKTLKGDTLFDSVGDGTKTKPYTIV